MQLPSLMVLLVSLSHCCEAARILAILPVPATSHHNLFRAVLTTLAERGHEVVSYTSLLQEKTVANYTEVFLDTVLPGDKVFTLELLGLMMKSSKIATFGNFWGDKSQIVQETFACEKMKKLRTSNEHFDLVILEAQFGQEAFLPFAYKFQAPVVLLQPFGSFSVVNKLTGNSLSLASIPDFSVPFSDKMTFYDRAISSYSILKTLYLYYSLNLPYQENLARGFFKDSSMPSLMEMAHNVSLVINNAHPFVHYSQPNTPNIVSVGGIHLTKTPKPLPLDIKKFIEESKDGVIYMSLGSFLPDHLLPDSYFDNFINVFRRLPQRVLWKTGYQSKNMPNNVMTLKWAPQQEILAHPKTVLFMTHGGLFGQHEAIHAGVPVVCIPFFGDQPMNAKFYEERQIGVELLYESLSESTIENAVKTVLGNKIYKENMQRLSLIYRDRPVSPSDTLVFWVEYVLRHRGAPHLQPASSHMPWYQLMLLDVLAAAGLVFGVLLAVVYLIVKTIFSRVFHKGTVKDVNLSSVKKRN